VLRSVGGEWNYVARDIQGKPAQSATVAHETVKAESPLVR
jgi:hypothetical protein